MAIMNLAHNSVHIYIYIMNSSVSCILSGEDPHEQKKGRPENRTFLSTNTISIFEQTLTVLLTVMSNPVISPFKVKTQLESALAYSLPL